MNAAQPSEEVWTLETAVREISKLRRENARQRLRLRDLENATSLEAESLVDGLRRVRGAIRHLQIQSTQILDDRSEIGLNAEEDEL